jgi:hypothetical protein
MNAIARIPWTIIIIACVTVGLAPYNPPHVWNKTILLFTGQLTQAVDWWDLFFHVLPWFLLVLKTVVSLRSRGK